MSPAEGDKGLVGGVVPLDGGVDLGLELLAAQEGVEDADAIEIKSIRVGGEVLEKVGQGFRGSKVPELFFPEGNDFADFFIGVEGMVKAGVKVRTNKATWNQLLRAALDIW